MLAKTHCKTVPLLLYNISSSLNTHQHYNNISDIFISTMEKHWGFIIKTSISYNTNWIFHLNLRILMDFIFYKIDWSTWILEFNINIRFKAIRLLSLCSPGIHTSWDFPILSNAWWIIFHQKQFSLERAIPRALFQRLCIYFSEDFRWWTSNIKV